MDSHSQFSFTTPFQPLMNVDLNFPEDSFTALLHSSNIIFDGVDYNSHFMTESGTVTPSLHLFHSHESVLSSHRSGCIAGKVNVRPKLNINLFPIYNENDFAYSVNSQDPSTPLNWQNTGLESETRDSNTSLCLWPNTTPMQFIFYKPPTKQKPNEGQQDEDIHHQANTPCCPALSTFSASAQTSRTFNIDSAVPASDALLTVIHCQEITEADFSLQNPVSVTTESVPNTAGSPEASSVLSEDSAEEDMEEHCKTWAGQNPTKVMIPEPQNKSWKGQNMEVRKIHKYKQCERCQNMAEELKRVQEHCHQQLQDIGTKYGQSFETIINYVLYSSRYKKQCSPSLYLAKVSAKAKEINKDRPIGKKVLLDEIKRMVQDENDGSDYEGLMKEEQDALLDHLKEK
ncbi:hypothetical protein F5146DRAFT_1144051 [Armillaria mellea]|nr:hypothetical protein F5146DRAFT_1144051 [Armillaria mellea]